MGLETIFSAFLMALALPNELFPLGNPLCGFFALCPYFLSLSRSRSYGEAAFQGLLFGLCSHGLSSYWLAYFGEFAFWTLGASCLAYGAFHAFLACFLRRACLPFPGLPFPGFPFSGLPPRISRPLALALAWTAWEWAKSTGFLGYPWGLLPYTVNNYPLMIQSADLTGPWGLSFLLALSSSLCAELIMTEPFRKKGRKFPRNLWNLRELLYNGSGNGHGNGPGNGHGNGPGPLVRFWCVLFAGNLVYGAYHLARPVPVQEKVPLLLVQHNADAWNGSELGALSEAMRLSNEGYAYAKTTAPLSAPLMIVWSETLLARPFEEYRGFFLKNPRELPLLPFLQEKNVYLLTGAPLVHDWEHYTAFNGAILISGGGALAASYAKQHLVPFAEAVPFGDKPWMASFMRDIVGFESGWEAGKESTVMELPLGEGKTLRFGTPICFEDAFGKLCGDFFRNGADILINLTNDSWSRQVSAETQHLAAARFRTVENRRVLVRSTNSGQSAVISAEGRILASLPCFEAAYLAVEVPVQIPRQATVYSVLGDWFPLCCGILFCAMIVLGSFRRPPRLHASLIGG
ncbi:MAG: apolipoprotein N-acyltransferase [Spirochaetaceae bacterium]|jgi:apolipoprotein N-acyltransferase|nr:apolipoprotein N-acyltransferase [Spirochaetaceae bacterium]